MTTVAGVDEAGRGAWAGPLVASAVALPANPTMRRAISRTLTHLGIIVNDSKQLTRDEREAVVRVLEASDASVSIVVAEVSEIDECGIGFINARSLTDAVLRLRPAPEFVLSDAFQLPNFGRNQLPIVRGDARSKSIAFASCVAKVTRDQIMIEADRQYPEYGFARHKGYGTPEHREMLERHGVREIHRTSFAPVRRIIHGC